MRSEIKIRKGEPAVELSSSPKPKPVFVLSAQEEEELTELQKKTIEDIQEALDEENLAELVRIVANLQARIANVTQKAIAQGCGMKKLAWRVSAAVPKSLRMKTVEALGWFGADGLPELAGYLADPDPEVRQYTYAQFEQSMQDITLSDRDRARIIIMASKVLSDDMTLDNMMMQIFDMRHSVALDTILEVAEVGTAAASAKMEEVMMNYTGETGITDEAKAAQWLKENPDGEFDEDFYGGWKME